MHYSLTADERDLQAGLRTSLSDLMSAASYQAICESESGFDADVWRELVAQGWLDLRPMSKELDVSAWPISGVVMAEEFGRIPLPAPVELVAGFLFPVMHELASGSLGLAIDGLSVSDLITCHLADLLRHVVRSGDPFDLRCREAADGLILDGTLRGVQFGAEARSVVVPAYSESGWILVRVDLAAAGVTVRPVHTLDAGRRSAEVVLSAVQVDEPAVARFNKGGEPLEATLVDALLSYLLFLDGKAVGACELLLERTISYVTERQQFGVPIGSFQAVKHKVADIATLIESSRSMASYTAWLVSQGADDRIEGVLSSRLHCADAYRRSCELAIQCHGGMGFTWEVGLHVWYRSATYDAAVSGLTLNDVARMIGRVA